MRADYAWYAHIYELTGLTYQGVAAGAADAYTYTTPSYSSSVGPTLCFFPVVAHSSSNMYPQYSMESGQTPDGCAVRSVNQGGVPDNFISACSHQETRAGGDASTGIAAFGSDGSGATIAYSLGAPPCPTPFPASTRAFFSRPVYPRRVLAFSTPTDR